MSNQHRAVPRAAVLLEEFVVRSLRHMMPTHLGAAGADAFTIKKLAGHSSVSLSGKNVHLKPEGVEHHSQRFEDSDAKQLLEGQVNKITTILNGKLEKRLSV